MGERIERLPDEIPTFARALWSVYTMRTVDGTVLYVGCSSRPFQRVYDHGKKDWFAQVATTTYEHFNSRALAHDAEREAIAEHQPPHNLRPGIHPSSDDELDARRREKTEREARNWEAYQLAQRRARFYEVPGLHCRQCDWTGNWIRKGTLTREAPCPNCKTTSLHPGESRVA